MRHRNHRFRLGRVSEHRTAMLRNMLVALFRHERIETTEAKAKAVRGLADHMVTLAKRESLHARRQALSMMPDTEASVTMRPGARRRTMAITSGCNTL